MKIKTYELQKIKEAWKKYRMIITIIKTIQTKNIVGLFKKETDVQVHNIKGNSLDSASKELNLLTLYTYVYAHCNIERKLNYFVGV